MRLVLLFVFGLLMVSVQAQKDKTPVKTTNPIKSSAGYNIPVKITPLKNTKLYLYNYYGKYYQAADSIMLNDKSEGVFKGNKKLAGGIYLVVTEKRVRLFDVLMDDAQHFSIVADTSKPDKPVITGSKENSLYQDYTKFLEVIGPKMNALQQELAASKTKEDSTRIQTAYSDANKQLRAFRENVVKAHPKSMLASFFNTMKRPETPAMPKKADGTLDSIYPYRYVKDHYWDDVDFADDRLVRTPPMIFENKLDEYYKYYVSPDADSIIHEVKTMLLYSREGKEMYRYLLAKFTNKYINPEIMGQDKVFVYLFENHYLKGDTTILSEKDKETIFKRGWSLIANQIGEPAPPMNLIDSASKTTALYDVKAPYTLVVFWDPNCGHCKETIPKVDSIYQAKWKALGMKIYAVNIDENTMKEWNNFIHSHNLNDWVHVYQPKAQRDAEAAANQPNFRQLYDVYKTPTLYLLDEQKRIIAKNLEVLGFDEVLTAKLKNKK
jgi:thiol-disulfide isomerase/thioredoxin